MIFFVRHLAKGVRKLSRRVTLFNLNKGNVGIYSACSENNVYLCPIFLHIIVIFYDTYYKNHRTE